MGTATLHKGDSFPLLLAVDQQSGVRSLQVHVNFPMKPAEQHLTAAATTHSCSTHASKLLHAQQPSNLKHCVSVRVIT
jgi:hypothetical protein